MRVTFGLAAVALTAVCAASLAADEAVPTVRIPEAYITGTAPAALAKAPKAAPAAGSLEKPAAVNGTLYAVIAPIYTGQGGTDSYLRLFNGGSAAATITVTVVGTPSSSNRGTASIQLAPRMAPQYTMGQIFSMAGATQAAGDTGYALYLQSAEPTAGYQHVTYNANGFFENMSLCKYTLNEAVKPIAASLVLNSVHTTALAGNQYPSQIDIHNFFNAAVTYRVTVIDAANGNVMGQVNVPITANTSYSAPMSFFETSVGWTPSASQLHANLVITDLSGAYPNAVVGQTVVNNQLASYINMGMACAINEPSIVFGGGGFGGGGISY